MQATDIYVQQGNEKERYVIGSVMPPVVNGKPIFTDDYEFMGKRSPSGQPVHVFDALDDLWEDWRMANPHPDADSEFVEWLVNMRGWTEVEAHQKYTIIT